MDIVHDACSTLLTRPYIEEIKGEGNNAIRQNPVVSESSLLGNEAKGTKANIIGALSLHLITLGI